MYLASCTNSAEEPEFDADHQAPTAWLVQALRLLKRDFTNRQAQQFLPDWRPRAD